MKDGAKAWAAGPPRRSGLEVVLAAVHSGGPLVPSSMVWASWCASSVLCGLGGRVCP